ncbi:MAG: hypothetical protein HQL51_15650 [Magnetococcales bacterium]|nr:hypothetical protein [Magnetococcales bacterium]
MSGSFDLGELLRQYPAAGHTPERKSAPKVSLPEIANPPVDNSNAIAWLALGKIVGEVGDYFQKVDEEKQKERIHLARNAATVKFSSGLLELQSALAGESDPGVYEEKAAEGLGRLQGVVFDGLDETTRGAVEAHLQEPMIRAVTRAKMESNRLFGEHVKASALSALDALKQEALAAPDHATFLDTVRRASEITASQQGYLGGADGAQTLARQWVDQTTWDRFQNDLFRNPASAAAQVEANPWGLTPERQIHARGKAQEALHAQSLDAARLQRQIDEMQALELENVRQGMVGAFYAGKLTARDVLESPLPAVGQGSKEHFMGLLARDEKASDPEIYRRSLAAAYDGKLAPADVIPLLNAGLSKADGGHVLAVIERAAKEDLRPEARAVQDWGRKIEAAVLNTGGGFSATPQSQLRAMAARKDFESEVQKMRGAGRDPMAVLGDPKNGEIFSRNIVSRYSLSAVERMKEVQQMFSPAASGGGLPVDKTKAMDRILLGDAP